MKRVLVASLVAAWALTSGCSTDSPVVYEGRPAEWHHQSRTPRKYGPYLEYMSSDERVAFHRLTSDRQRDLFIEEHGVNVRKMLDDLLVLGMPASRVRQILGPPRFQETLLRDIRDEHWIYYRFNGFRRSRYMVYFKSGRVVGWDAFAD